MKKKMKGDFRQPVFVPLQIWCFCHYHYLIEIFIFHGTMFYGVISKFT